MAKKTAAKKVIGRKKGDAGNKVKAPRAKKAANGTHAGASDNAIRANFLSHRTKWIDFQSKLAAVNKIGKEVKAALKAAGHSVKEMKIADALAGTPQQEERIRREVHDRLRVAKWLSHPMGKQLDMFENPPGDKRITVEDAQDLGRLAAMEGMVAKPPEHLSPELAQSWLAAYHQQQADQVRGGIKPLPDPARPLDEKTEAAGWGESSGTAH